MNIGPTINYLITMLPLNDLRLDSLLQSRASGAGVAEQLSRLSGAGVSLAGVSKDTLVDLIVINLARRTIRHLPLTSIGTVSASGTTGDW